MCSETSEAVGTTWEHAQLEFQKFLKIRIALVKILQQGPQYGQWRARSPHPPLLPLRPRGLDALQLLVRHQWCHPLRDQGPWRCRELGKHGQVSLSGNKDEIIS